VKLQKQLSRKFEGKEYPKYVVTIPPKQIEEVGWKEGIELEATVRNGRITLKPKV
jgi:bifunctional DNA-binding transcriptional regulator/antitoxin component of YhaV-PrlF toxin-antitoxin module